MPSSLRKVVITQHGIGGLRMCCDLPGSNELPSAGKAQNIEHEMSGNHERQKDRKVQGARDELGV